MAAVKDRRKDGDVRKALQELKSAIERGENLMSPIIEAVRCYATIGEICGIMREKWGEFKALTYI